MTDACPRCLRRHVPPYVDAEDYDGNLHASYRCPACGHSWVTRRTAEPEPSRYATYDDPDAWEAEDDFSDYDGPAYDPRFGEPPW
ncbi:MULTISPECIES: hypothetical protein [Streptomyces]|uniref:hypothetical protein n=1 Tax=Streptomyces TaxID=1883 RepID=UPI00345B6237